MAKTQSDRPKMVNLRELSEDTACAILEIQSAFAETTASKAVVRAIERYMPLYRDNEKNRKIITDRNNEIRQLNEAHAEQLKTKKREITELKNTIYNFLQAQETLEINKDKLKKLIR